MTKRVLAILCALTVLISCIAFASLANATTSRYLVGYAIKDMNPWLDYNDHSKGLNIGLFNLTGNGDDDTRPLSGLFDDNGDGVHGEGDGLYTTATAVTDSYGKTVIYVTIDALQSWSQITTDARSAIVAELGSDVIAPEQIMICASHTHSGGFFASMRSTSVSAAKREYYWYVINQITAAAVEAYGDRAEAVMTKGTVNAKEATANWGYNNGNGYHMNAIRHYEVTVKSKYFSAYKKSYSYMIGSGDGIESPNEIPYYPDYRKTTVTTDTADNNMHVLKFDFPYDSTKEPVVFVNWRAHTTMNSGVDKTLLSSDYVNGLRTKLKENGYRTAFFQGAAGNVVTTAKLTAWASDASSKDWRADAKVTSDSVMTYIYGTMLAEVAMDCMNGKMSDEITAGRIVNAQMTWHGELQQDNDGLRAGAAYLQQLENEGTSVEYPYTYTHTDGNRYIINTSTHRNHILTRAEAPADHTDLELNAIALGNGVVFITAPNELVDHYNVGSMKEEENDWLDLEDDTYGTPFVLGYTNGTSGYIANWMDYIYNTPEYYEITGYGENGNEFFGPGTYESMISRFAQGEGERLLETYHEMIDTVMEGERMVYCEACQETVAWKPIMGTPRGTLNLGTGHYYLYNDLPLGEPGKTRFSIKSGGVLCLDLNGHMAETPGRSAYLADEGSTLNLHDSVGGGKMVSYTAGNNIGGGAVGISSGTTLNMYGGAIQFVKKSSAGVNDTGFGAVVNVNSKGKLNMYGGKLIGGEIAMSAYYGSTNTSNGRGGTIFVNNDAEVNVFGGEIIAGAAPYEGYGDCIYLAGSKCRVVVSGDAKIDEIFMNTLTSNQITITGNFTGKLGIRTASLLPTGSTLATLSGAKITDASLTYTAKPGCEFRASGSLLKLYQRSGDAAVVYENYEATSYTALTEALAACDKGTITLLKNNSENVIISKDTYIDLNGCNLIGRVMVDEGKTLYGMDSATDDFTVADGLYGKITNATGSVCGVAEESAYTRDSYLMLSDEEGLSFHRVQLQLTAMSFRPEAMGLYYKSSFAGDELVAQNIERFGVALCLTGEPNAENFTTQCKYSWFTDFQSGATGNATDNCSTLLKGIMKSTNTQEVNTENASLPIYGRAYALTKDGQYLFGHSNSRTLKLQLKDVDKIWSSLTSEQKKAVEEVYNQYKTIMKSWGFSNLK